MNPVEEFLRNEATILRTFSSVEIGGYCGMADFVVKNGREFSTDNPLTLPLMRMKECFRNASWLAMRDKSYTYCEGYAVGVIPVMHAWVVKDGRIGETTWPELGSAYYGITFKTEYLRKELLTSKRYGLIDRWWDDWPLLTQPKEQWHHDGHVNA